MGKSFLDDSVDIPKVAQSNVEQNQNNQDLTHWDNAFKIGELNGGYIMTVADGARSRVAVQNIEKVRGGT